ncbi:MULTISPECIES: cytosine permease [Kocuria]|uniref:cytosine permease n=1 Tax=Kocuria TaxID=57493 RepID=UPI0022E41677|nr:MULTISPECIES: cytosine permease [Kocuria]
MPLLWSLFGIIMVDYWLIRRSSVNVPQLSMDTHDGEYVYRGGVTPRAIGAFVPTILASLAVALLPVFQAVGEFS